MAARLEGHAGRKIITVFDQEFQKFVERVDVTSFIDMLDIEELQHTVQLNRIQVSTYVLSSKFSLIRKKFSCIYKKVTSRK